VNVFIEKHENLTILSRQAAEYVCKMALVCVRKCGFFALMLSGRTIPRLFCEYLACSPYLEKMPCGPPVFFNMIRTPESANNPNISYKLTILTSFDLKGIL